MRTRLSSTWLILLMALGLSGCGGAPLASAASPRHAAALEVRGDDFMDRTFRVLDRNRDQALAPEELDLTPAQRQVFDQDGDGLIARAEWTAQASPAQLRRAKRVFQAQADALERLVPEAAGGGMQTEGVVSTIGQAILGRYLAMTSRIAAERAIHPKRMKLYATPAKFGLSYRDVSFKTEDGLTIKGWYIPSTRPDAKTLILVHGHADCRSAFVRDGQIAWLQPHYNLLAIDLRNNGESEGSATSFGFHEGQDVAAAARYLQAHGDRHVGVYGVSMGAASAIRGAALEPTIEVVVNDSAFATIRSAFSGFVSASFAPNPVLISAAMLARANQALGIDMTETEPITQVARIAPRPFWVAHGSEDHLITPDNGRLNFIAAGENLTKDFWIVPGGAHGLGMVAQPAEYRRRLLEFLERAW